jgi:hypothetical protein
MSGVREKGKIAHSEWPKIVERYRAGETIAQIGRDYGCTAPAIRYIIKRTDGLRAMSAQDGANRLPGEAKAVAAAPREAKLRVSTASASRGVLALELRKRISGDIASFLVALDQAVVEGSARSTGELQEATDRLMRSTARIRIELERLLAGGRPPEARQLRGHAVTSARGA